MTELDPVRRVLTDRGSPAEVVNGGLDGLLERWTSVVDSVAAEYPLTLDDYLNDMDVRDALAAVLLVVSETEAGAARLRLDPLDERFRTVTVATGCLWGDDVEEDDALDPGREWWYYRRPLHLNDDLASELEAWGLMDAHGDAT
jgi:hypothetical protein